MKTGGLPHAAGQDAYRAGSASLFRACDTGRIRCRRQTSQVSVGNASNAIERETTMVRNQRRRCPRRYIDVRRRRLQPGRSATANYRRRSIRRTSDQGRSLPMAQPSAEIRCGVDCSERSDPNDRPVCVRCSHPTASVVRTTKCPRGGPRCCFRRQRSRAEKTGSCDSPSSDSASVQRP